MHRASAPGEPPAPDTGELVDSVTYQMRPVPGGGWAAEAGSRLKKAMYLEFGAARVTSEGATWILFPRPAWGPALRSLEPEINAVVRRIAPQTTPRIQWGS